jgi:CDP-diacylglycerol--serine O-phosphatidyltransferase
MFTVGLVLGLNSPFADSFQLVLSSPSAIIAMVLIQSALLVSPIPMFSLKIKSFNFRETWKQQLLIILALIAIFVFGKAALSLVMLLYVVISLISWPLNN